MLRILVLTLALLFVPTGAADAGYLWKGDTVVVRRACHTSNMATSLADLYATGPTARANAAWKRAVELDLCVEMDRGMIGNLGKLLGRWAVFDTGKVMEVWGVVDAVGYVMYAMFNKDGGGLHETPYELGPKKINT